MESQKNEVLEVKLLKQLVNLRKMMVHNHDLENLSEFVLHDLCKQSYFNVRKAAYFVNNPDFRCLRGITGYHDQELVQELDLTIHDAWNNQKEFISFMKKSSFNQKVRNRSEKNFDRGSSSEKYMVDKLADELEIANPAYNVWNLKHSNHGLFIYESLPAEELILEKDHLLDSLHHLSFCPIY